MLQLGLWLGLGPGNGFFPSFFVNVTNTFVLHLMVAVTLVVAISWNGTGLKCRTRNMEGRGCKLWVSIVK